ncbi:MAG: hypothetical protein WAK88_06860, partial [Candidatus Cybelea sp.]
MISIPISQETARRALQRSAVAVVTAAALGFSLPNLLQSPNPLRLGYFDFTTTANVVAYAGADARKAGIEPGDRIDYFRMPPGERYGFSEEGLREPEAGKAVSFVVDRRGRTHVARLKAQSEVWEAGGGATYWLLLLSGQKAIFLVLVLVAAALVLIRPSKLTGAFFLFAAGNGVTPMMYSFLPPAAYGAIMVADDALAGLGAIGFFALGLYLDPKRRVRSRPIAGIAALLFATIVVPLAASDLSEILVGVRPAWPLAGWASFGALWLCYIAGIAALIRVVASTGAPRGLRLLAALLAAVGALTILDWTFVAQLNSWYAANLPAVAMNRGVDSDRELLLPFWFYGTWPFIFRLLGALLALYLLVYAGIAGAGPVLRRLASYVIVALLVVAGFSLANVALMPSLATHALVVPFEILAAIAIGYWVSGLRDLAGSLSLACVDAWGAWANGRAQEERDALAQSLGLAQRSRRRRIIAEVRAQIAFSSWRSGEDGAFEEKIAMLRRVLRGHNMGGIRAFAEAATSGDGVVFQEDDLPEWRARAALVLCSRTNDAIRARQLAADALACADRAGLASLQVLASIAVAETCAERRNASLEQAHAIARDAGWPVLSKSILALRASSRDIGILQPFVEVRLRKSRPARAFLEVSFFDGALSVSGVRVPLPEKQLELLLTV